jgi:putative PEP-CTERM system histidine kinase
MAWFGLIGFGVAALAYAVTAAILFVSRPGSRPAMLLTMAAALSAVWAGGIVVVLVRPEAPFVALVFLDELHLLAWIACALSWLQPAAADGRHLARYLFAVPAGALGAWALSAAVLWPLDSPILSSIFVALLGTALIGLLIVEQVFRNARDEQRQRFVFMCLAVGGIFVVDLVAYAHATLLGDVLPFIWQARGLANAALVPILLIAIKRQSEWERELFVSRQVAFYSTTLVGVGSYLVAMAAIAYVLSSAGGQWGLALQALFLVVALAVLLTALFSASIRARFKVFLVKHFYRNKYDYRDEWLRLTGSLGRSGDLRALVSSALQGVARIVASDRGSLWLTRDGQRYERMESLGTEGVGAAVYDHHHPLVAFFAAKGWVVDSDEYAAEPDLYGTAFGAPDEAQLPPNSIAVPLDCQGTLQGFVILARQPNAEPLNFEDHDIPKTAGRQVAVVLAQALAQERLAETRQSEAVHKLTTFLMHDLKNLIAQHDHVVANAQRFRHRPEFIDDAITTVKSGVERMRKVLDQLQRAARKEPQWSRVDVAKVLMEVRSQCADRKPVPSIELPTGAVWVRIDRERLASVFTHLVRNAQDATPPDGRIEVRVERAGDDVSIRIADNGRGMDPAFVRDRLFRPFDSTKGAQGMGIGAYQARDIVRAAGGEVGVRSEPGTGTVFDVRLPLERAQPVEEPAA